MSNLLRIQLPRLIIGALIFSGIAFTDACIVSREVGQTAQADQNTEGGDPGKSESTRPNEFIDLNFLDVSSWIGFSDDGTVWKTDDGGSSWRAVKTFPGKIGFGGSRFIDRKTGFFTFDNKLYKTIDGGESWAEIYDFKPQLREGFDGISSTFFLNQRVGWSVGLAYPTRKPAGYHEGIVFRTTDGGLNWHRGEIVDRLNIAEISGGRWDLRDVYFTSEKTGWAVGAAAILKTEDGGDHWRLQRSEGVFEKVDFVTPQTGIITEKLPAASLITSDGGLTWKNIKLTAFQELNPGSKITVSRSNEIIVFGPDGKILISNPDHQKWYEPRILSGEWRYSMEQNEFGNSYIGRSVQGSIVCLRVIWNGGSFLAIRSTDEGKTWIK